jgi:hypothetical protein
VPAIGVAVRAAGIYLTWPSVETVTVSSIPMGVGLLFSHSLCASQARRQFASTRPAAPQTLKLLADKTKVTVPDELVKRNLLVEVSALGNTGI